MHKYVFILFSMTISPCFGGEKETVKQNDQEKLIDGINAIRTISKHADVSPIIVHDILIGTEYRYPIGYRSTTTFKADNFIPHHMRGRDNKLLEKEIATFDIDVD